MEHEPPGDLPARVQAMQIIVIALTMGLVFFLAIVCFAGPAFNLGGAFGGLPVLTVMGLALAAIELVARTVVVAVMAAAARRKLLRGEPIAGSDAAVSEAAQLVSLYQTRMIVSAACLEGGAFFLLIAYMLERSPFALVAAFGLILGVALHFPTRPRVAKFVGRQMSLIEEERQFGAA